MGGGGSLNKNRHGREFVHIIAATNEVGSVNEMQDTLVVVFESILIESTIIFDALCLFRPSFPKLFRPLGNFFWCLYYFYKWCGRTILFHFDLKAVGQTHWSRARFLDWIRQRNSPLNSIFKQTTNYEDQTCLARYLFPFIHPYYFLLHYFISFLPSYFIFSHVLCLLFYLCAFLCFCSLSFWFFLPE